MKKVMRDSRSVIQQASWWLRSDNPLSLVCLVYGAATNMTSKSVLWGLVKDACDYGFHSHSLRLSRLTAEGSILAAALAVR